MSSVRIPLNHFLNIMGCCATFQRQLVRIIVVFLQLVRIFYPIKLTKYSSWLRTQEQDPQHCSSLFFWGVIHLSLPFKLQGHSHSFSLLRSILIFIRPPCLRCFHCSPSKTTRLANDGQRMQYKCKRIIIFPEHEQY